MRRKSVADQPCPVARCLERVGDWWNILILRDALHGLTRFDHFQRSLAIAPNTLARRLRALIDAGLLERHRYQERPPRYDYRLTPSGREFRTVLMALHAFGNRHYAPDGASVVLVDRRTGRPVEPLAVDGRTGRPLDEPGFELVAGPKADASVRRRLAFVARFSPVFGGETVEEKPSEGAGRAPVGAAVRRRATTGRGRPRPVRAGRGARGRGED